MVVQSQLSKLDQMWHYMFYLADPVLLTGEGGYYLGVFEAAIHYIRNWSPEQMRVATPDKELQEQSERESLPSPRMHEVVEAMAAELSAAPQAPLELQLPQPQPQPQPEPEPEPALPMLDFTLTVEGSPTIVPDGTVIRVQVSTTAALDDLNAEIDRHLGTQSVQLMLEDEDFGEWCRPMGIEDVMPTATIRLAVG